MRPAKRDFDPSKKKPGGMMGLGMVGTGRKKACRFCSDALISMDYKEPKFLTFFVSERGKIVPRRLTGNCAFHQRRITEAVKRARILALLPFTASHR